MAIFKVVQVVADGALDAVVEQAERRALPGAREAGLEGTGAGVLPAQRVAVVRPEDAELPLELHAAAVRGLLRRRMVRGCMHADAWLPGDGGVTMAGVGGGAQTTSRAMDARAHVHVLPAAQRIQRSMCQRTRGRATRVIMACDGAGIADIVGVPDYMGAQAIYWTGTPSVHECCARLNTACVRTCGRARWAEPPPLYRTEPCTHLRERGGDCGARVHQQEVREEAFEGAAAEQGLHDVCAVEAVDAVGAHDALLLRAHAAELPARAQAACGGHRRRDHRPQSAEVSAHSGRA